MDDQHDVWQRIGPSFDSTRQRTWAHVDAFRAKHAGRMLDLMCGNGRHLDGQGVGLDFSAPLCAAAAARGPIVQGDATALPFADGVFDACTYVAGLHGIPSAEGRLASLRELARVLRPEAEAQITVWSRDAPRFAKMDLDPGPADVTVPWRRDEEHGERFYHLYTAGSLTEACLRAGFRHVEVRPIAIAADTPDNLVATVAIA